MTTLGLRLDCLILEMPPIIRHARCWFKIAERSVFPMRKSTFLFQTMSETTGALSRLAIRATADD